MICLISSGNTSGVCRNPSCVSETDCTCAQATPTPRVVTVTPTPAPIPDVPVAGSSLQTVVFGGIGLTLILLGLAL